MKSNLLEVLNLTRNNIYNLNDILDTFRMFLNI